VHFKSVSISATESVSIPATESTGLPPGYALQIEPAS
jgi:hypothetical protein